MTNPAGACCARLAKVILFDRNLGADQYVRADLRRRFPHGRAIYAAELAPAGRRTPSRRHFHSDGRSEVPSISEDAGYRRRSIPARRRQERRGTSPSCGRSQGLALPGSSVGEGGLEPPPPCGDMALNHARLPVPPLALVAASCLLPQPPKSRSLWLLGVCRCC